MSITDQKQTKLILNHSYIPDWISVPFTVTEFRGKRVFVEFDSGHKRNFFISLLERDVTHDPDCLICMSDKDD